MKTKKSTIRWRTPLLITLIAILFVLLSASFAYKSFSSFISRSTGVSLESHLQTINRLRRDPSVNLPLNFIILGLDGRNDDFEKTTTTDTIMFASLRPDRSLKLVSIPRDLWDYQTNSKINHYYPKSKETDDGTKYLLDNFSRLTGQKISNVLVLETSDLAKLIEIINGVDVQLKIGFVDQKYPNPEYIKNPSPKIPIYKTISFPSGLIHLDSTNITEFVRSRKGSDIPELGGTDLGRINRQQLVIDALIEKLKNYNYRENPEIIFMLYRFWREDLETNFTDLDVLKILRTYGVQIKQINISKISIPVGINSQDGVIYHPDKFINQQWVFTTKSKDFSELHQFISSSLQ